MYKARRRKERRRGRLTWYMKMSPERRDLVPEETINSSLQWLCEGPRASRGPSGEEAGGPMQSGKMRDNYISLLF